MQGGKSFGSYAEGFMKNVVEIVWGGEPTSSCHIPCTAGSCGQQLSATIQAGVFQFFARSAMQVLISSASATSGIDLPRPTNSTVWALNSAVYSFIEITFIVAYFPVYVVLNLLAPQIESKDHCQTLIPSRP
jgi:hypothetical protein